MCPMKLTSVRPLSKSSQGQGISEATLSQAWRPVQHKQPEHLLPEQDRQLCPNLGEGPTTFPQRATQEANQTTSSAALSLLFQPPWRGRGEAYRLDPHWLRGWWAGRSPRGGVLAAGRDSMATWVNIPHRIVIILIIAPITSTVTPSYPVFTLD